MIYLHSGKPSHPAFVKSEVDLHVERCLRPLMLRLFFFFGRKAQSVGSINHHPQLHPINTEGTSVSASHSTLQTSQVIGRRKDLFIAFQLVKQPQL